MTIFSTAGLFIALSLLIALLLAVITIMPWLRATRTSGTSVDNQLLDINVAVFRERLAELKTDKDSGTIDDAHYQNQKLELERQLLDAQREVTPMVTPGIKSRLILMVWVPVLAALAYLMVGDRTPVFDLWTAEDKVGKVADDLLTGKIDQPPVWAIENGQQLISAMQTNVYRHADDPDRWMRLSELFLSLEATDSALEALSRAYRLAPDNEEIATTYAQISFFANKGQLDASSRRVLQDVLAKNPQHEGAQMLMAMGEARGSNFAEAQGWIKRLRESIAAKPGDHSKALASLDELSANIVAQEQQASQGIEVTVSVDAALLPLVKADDVLFVAIRDVKGGPPFAAKRLPISVIKQGKASIRLSDLDAMMPERTLQSARSDKIKLAVVARVSHSGTASAESGDLSGNPVVVSAEQTQVNIEINQQIP
ncbi:MULTISPECIES: c-type cytochrome biogenesis protein CcmI [Psychrobacter]|jgi:cytochrome c-type biogenesis protein CcmI|uniref:c-type cytochrome biogenesis protein CcmI n=2 Tax=Moraxellaceae TaxID=468 RepID=UPI000C31E5E4|nr:MULTISPECIES: c-type cytochrome biogenesis protein CcmI [Psychrobacter]MBA6245554.1 c-type cytochrome biogenesis protein CcmI [Psychrobacter sp. Urea-trap-18]MBA6284687.1 c-type cytochrome biogenesis protein CcmI [Psychrobacter sp. Urea-trap-16]MBA6318169.1 c-type cytochrome biogenesis protein CcmI [Psychrobacter sp. Urea-trap-20]MBA6332992.1 c-type cytochrome biogenesis protein CcmI [Psychrobacter sp. Urea-trap-19]PKG59833.1 c-type cytochrome biogenesis protein CcmI [Psychrobacter sp. Chol|tara:strand:+ start:3749 stop:5029 length:1281 start_codon:yes stop_codon:yes gene_type:complete